MLQDSGRYYALMDPLVNEKMMGAPFQVRVGEALVIGKGLQNLRVSLSCTLRQHVSTLTLGFYTLLSGSWYCKISY